MAYHFNTRIEIIGLTTGINDEGGYSEIETVVAKPWADVKTMRGQEYEAMGFEVNAEPIRFVIRYRKGITVKQKVKFDGNIYNINSVANDGGLNRTLTIFAKKKAA